jgi:ATP-binding cassette subfamily B protein RaxB
MLTLFSNKKLPLYLQDQLSECGLTSLAMILKYHKFDVDLSSLRNKYPISLEGMSCADITEICEAEGFIGDTYEMEMKNFPQLVLPAILHWDLSHFVVLKSIKNNKFIIHDPAIGELTLTEKDVSKHFTGYAVQIEPMLNELYQDSKKEWENKDKDNRLTLGYFFRKTVNIKKSMGFILFMTLIAQILTMVIPAITQVIIDDFISGSTTDYMWYFIIGGLMIVVFRFLAQIIKGWAVIFMGYRLHASLSSYFFKRLVKLPMSYYENRTVADIFSRFGALNELKDTLTERVIDGVIDGFMSIITITAMFFYSPFLASITLGFMLAYLLLRYYFLSKQMINNQRYIMEKIKENGSFFDTIHNAQSVKIYGREEKRYQHWKKFYLSSANESVELTKAGLWYGSSEGLFEGIENVLLLCAGAFAVINESMSLGMLFAFFAYRTIFTGQSKSMINNVLELKLLTIHLDRLSDVENEEIEANLIGKNISSNVTKGEIEVRNLSFKFTGSKEFLFENVSFKIKAGENVVFTGPSGCGKSTLIKIIMGLMQPESGKVLVDGCDINDIGMIKYRKHIAAVSQMESLIAGNIMDNITFFDDITSMERVVDSAKKACVHDDIIKSPMQYNTVVGDTSNTLSGGQAQRVLLARAIYKQPKILFLDEATSFLDQSSEKAIVKSLKELPMTRISVAHRMETIAMAEREIKFEDLLKG